MVQRSQVPLPRSHSPEAELGCSPADRAGSGRQGSWSTDSGWADLQPPMGSRWP